MEVEILQMITQLGLGGIFAYLFWKERGRSSAIRDEHIRDLRYIAQIRHDRLGDSWNGNDPESEDLSPQQG